MKRWVRGVLWGFVAVAAVACGKSADFIGVGGSPYQPLYQAPSPYGYAGGAPVGFPNLGYAGPGYPPPGFPAAGAYPGVPTFSPQMPNGFPTPYTPFLPIDYFFRTNPQLAPYWPAFWSQWVGYAGLNGYSAYDFSHFWFNYCPQHWNSGGFMNLYAYLGQNFYYWMQPGIQFAPNLSPAYFWHGYQGFTYGASWSYRP